MKTRPDRNATTLPATMKAAAVDSFGPPSRLKLHELPVPKPGANEVLISLDTAGVGIWDASIRNGSWRKGRPRFPLVPGVDGAGVVVAKGPRAKRFQIGDRVYAYEFGNKQGGFYAQFAAAGAEHVARVPKGLDLREAGAAATTGLTALQGVTALRLRPGSNVLIFGASGAVGTMAVQFAAAQRAAVIATASGKAAARLVASLGASAVIDARSAPALNELRRVAPEGLDAVLALAGGDELERLLDFVRPGGRVVYPNGVEPAPRKRRRLKVEGYDGEASPAEFAKLNRVLTRIKARVPVAASYPLARAAEAHRRLERDHVLGRIVLKVNQR
jgi:NADPH:quinone reductase-like Zn-dependent oxidoreductase